MARVLLNGPAVTIAPRQNLGGQRSNAILESRRRAARSLNHFRIEFSGKVEIKPSISPFDASAHFGFPCRMMKDQIAGRFITQDVYTEYCRDGGYSNSSMVRMHGWADQ